MKLLKIGGTCFFCLLLLFENSNSQNTDSNKEVVRRYFEVVVNEQNLELLNTVFADSFRSHILTDNAQENNMIESQKEFLTYLFNAFPDIHYTISDLIEEGDKVVARVMLPATHKGEFWGYDASGNKIGYLSEIFFYRFENGKVVEQWVQFDLHNLFRILGNNTKSNN